MFGDYHGTYSTRGMENDYLVDGVSRLRRCGSCDWMDTTDASCRRIRMMELLLPILFFGGLVVIAYFMRPTDDDS